MSIKISVYDGFSISGIAYVHVVACVFCFWNNHYISTNIQTAGQFRSGAEFHLLYSWNKGTNSLVQFSYKNLRQSYRVSGDNFTTEVRTIVKRKDICRAYCYFVFA